MQSIDFNSLTGSALRNPLTHKDLKELEQFYDFISELNEIYQKVLFNAPTYDSVNKVKADIRPICIRAYDMYRSMTSSQVGSVAAALFNNRSTSIFERLNRCITHRDSSGSSSGIETIGSWGAIDNPNTISYTEMNPQVSISSISAPFTFPAIVRMRKGHISAQPFRLDVIIEPDFAHCTILPALMALTGPESLALTSEGEIAVRLFNTSSGGLEVNYDNQKTEVGILVGFQQTNPSPVLSGLVRKMTFIHDYGGGSSTPVDSTMYASYVVISTGSNAFSGPNGSGQPILLTEYLTECNIFNLLPTFLKEIDSAKQFIDWFYTTINSLIENIDLNDDKRREKVAISMRYGALQQSALYDVGLGSLLDDAFSSLMSYLRGSDSDI